MQLSRGMPRPCLSISGGIFLVPLDVAAGALEDLTFEPKKNLLQLQVPSSTLAH